MPVASGNRLPHRAGRWSRAVQNQVRLYDKLPGYAWASAVVGVHSHLGDLFASGAEVCASAKLGHSAPRERCAAAE